MELSKNKELPPYDKISKLNDALRYAGANKANEKKELGLGCQYEHSFTEGQYIRKMFIPKDLAIVTAIHTTQHPYFILEGDVSVFLNGETVRIKAPYCGVTEPGTQRVLRTHEDTVWITVHVTDKTDVESIVKDIVVENYDEYKKLISNDKREELT
jgi:mannose-6-phosphate isomerase-like protein (cupin superfamily)